MSNETIALLLEQIDSLRKALFSALNDVRKELGGKIDDSAIERREQIKDLMEKGCHQGQLDRQTIAQHEASLKRLENLWASLAINTKCKEPQQSEETGKNFKFQLGKVIGGTWAGYSSYDICKIVFVLFVCGILSYLIYAHVQLQKQIVMVKQQTSMVGKP